MTRTMNATAATTNKQKATNDLILATENQTKQEVLTYTDLVDNQLSDDLESLPPTPVKSFLLPEPQLTRVTKRHKANRAYFEI